MREEIRDIKHVRRFRHNSYNEKNKLGKACIARSRTDYRSSHQVEAKKKKTAQRLSSQKWIDRVH